MAVLLKLRSAVVCKSVVNCLRTTLYTTRTMSSYVAINEPVLNFAKGSKETSELEKVLKEYENKTVDVPIIIGDEEIRTDNIRKQVAPFDHQRVVATFYYATPEIIQKAIESCLKARREWEGRPLKERCDIFLRAADLISKKYRMKVIATTMIGQAKNVYQAEIDAAAELIDFLRFDAKFAQNTTSYQPLSPEPNVTINTINYRGLEGFWAAICPFNFTAIGGHLAVAPAMMGNVALWKPSDTAILSNYEVYKIYREAGLPAGVINFVPADGPVFGDTCLSSPDFVGLNFTGSVPTFKKLWMQIGQSLDIYKSYPRIIGECGGKNMHFVHPSAHVESVANGTVRSAFEYNGQKCSACSRMYVPQSLWPKVKGKMLEILKEVKMGSPLDRESFATAVIDDKAFARITGYIEHAKSSPNLTIVAGGKYDNSKGYFIEPTVIVSTDPSDRIMQEEIFGPIVSVYVYADDDLNEAVNLAQTSSPYALTGAIYVEDKTARSELVDAFRHNAGNFYINDKCTGSVVGQQPFGGARLSGTNDKAGGPHYMARFINPQATKETFVPLTSWKYPSMEN